MFRMREIHFTQEANWIISEKDTFQNVERLSRHAWYNHDDAMLALDNPDLEFGDWRALEARD